MGRFCFGEVGSRLSDFLLGFTQIGWYAWGTATIAIVLVRLLALPGSWTLPLMVLFGFGFCLTAFVGYKGLDLLSRIAVPAMLILLIASLWTATRDIGGLDGLLAVQPGESLTLGMAITMIFGTFVSGATQATNWTRFARNSKVAVWASLIGFFIGNGLMIVAGAYGAIVYQQPDIVEVLVLQGLSMAAVVMLFLNLWTTQDNTIYNFAAAGCNLLRTERRRLVTLGGAFVGTLLALGGMYELLIPFLILLGSIIPPIGGVIMADYFYRHRGQYPKLAEAHLPGTTAWAWRLCAGCRLRLLLALGGAHRRHTGGRRSLYCAVRGPAPGPVAHGADANRRTLIKSHHEHPQRPPARPQRPLPHRTGRRAHRRHQRAAGAGRSQRGRHRRRQQSGGAALHRTAHPSGRHPDRRRAGLEHERHAVRRHRTLGRAQGAGDPRRHQGAGEKTIDMLVDHGIQHVRTHVDVTDPTLSALKSMLEVRETRHLIDLQIVAFPQEGIESFRAVAS